MPLYANSGEAIRKNLELIHDRRKVHIVPIGVLTAEQLGAINAGRFVQKLGPIISEVVFVGGHIYRSRILQDGYTIEDVLDQVSSAMDSGAIILDALYMTLMENPKHRQDRYGNLVKDRAVLECSTRHPRAELFSVIPKGDKNKPAK